MPESIRNIIMQDFVLYLRNGAMSFYRVWCARGGAVFLFFLMGGCNDCSYEVDSITRVRVRIVDENGKEKRVKFTTITAVGSGTTRPLYADQTSAIYELPLDPLATESQFLFKDRGFFDTITVNYKVRYEPITPNCGVKEIITDLQVRTDDFMLKSPKVIHSQPLVYNKYDVEIQF